jgi:hypothetical protein
MPNLATQHSRFGVDLCFQRALRSCGPDSIYLSACLQGELSACAHDAALRRSRNPGISVNKGAKPVLFILIFVRVKIMAEHRPQPQRPLLTQEELKKKFEISNFDLNAILRGAQLTVVGGIAHLKEMTSIIAN